MIFFKHNKGKYYLREIYEPNRDVVSGLELTAKENFQYHGIFSDYILISEVALPEKMGNIPGRIKILKEEF